MSPLGIIVDSESEDEYSVASTPVSSKSPRTLVPLRRTLSSSALDDAETSIHTEDLFSPRSFDIDSPRFSPPPRPIGKERDLDEKWLDVPPEDDDDHSETDSLELGLGIERPAPVEYRSTSTSSANEWQLPPIHPSTPDRVTRTTHSPNDGTRLINSLWSLSPIAKAFKDSTPRTIRRPSLPKKSDFSLTKRKTSIEASEHSDDDVHNNNSNNNNSSSNSNTFGFGNSSNSNHNASRPSSASNIEQNEVEYTSRFEFEAPRKGQLGLVIESSNKTGPTVHAVKFRQ